MMIVQRLCHGTTCSWGSVRALSAMHSVAVAHSLRVVSDAATAFLTRGFPICISVAGVGMPMVALVALDHTGVALERDQGDVGEASSVLYCCHPNATRLVTVI